jgi:hypothetical protein
MSRSTFPHVQGGKGEGGRTVPGDSISGRGGGEGGVGHLVWRSLRAGMNELVRSWILGLLWQTWGSMAALVSQVEHCEIDFTANNCLAHTTSRAV